MEAPGTCSTGPRSSLALSPSQLETDFVHGRPTAVFGDKISALTGKMSSLFGDSAMDELKKRVSTTDRNGVPHGVDMLTLLAGIQCAIDKGATLQPGPLDSQAFQAITFLQMKPLPAVRVGSAPCITPAPVKGAKSAKTMPAPPRK